MDVVFGILIFIGFLLIFIGKIYSIVLSFEKSNLLGFINLALPVSIYHIILNFKKGQYILYLFLTGFLILVSTSYFQEKYKSAPLEEKYHTVPEGVGGQFSGKNKTGVWTHYYDNGQVMCEGNFIADKKHGKFTTYYETGEKMNEEVYENGVKTGTWIYWQKNGDIEKEELYVDGVLMK